MGRQEELWGMGEAILVLANGDWETWPFALSHGLKRECRWSNTSGCTDKKQLRPDALDKVAWSCLKLNWAKEAALGVCWKVQLHSMQYIWCDRVLYGARCLQISIVDDVIISNGVLMPYWPQVTGKVAAGNIVKVLVLKMSIVFATGCDVLW